MKCCRNSDYRRWTVWSSVKSDLPGGTRGVDRRRNRSHSVRLHPAVHHAPLLEQQAKLSKLSLFVECGDASVNSKFEKGAKMNILSLFSS